MFSFEIKSSAEDNLSWYSQERYLQTKFWADFKGKHGWKNFRFDVVAKPSDKTDENPMEEISFTISILVRRFAKIFHLAYVPMGILVENSKLNNEDYLVLLQDFSKEIRSYLPKNTICLRYDPPMDFLSPEERDEFVKSHFNRKTFIKKNSVDIQPPDTTILDLSKTEDELLANMKAKWRYNIRLAEKKGVEIIQGGSKDIDIFYNLYLETSKRDGIAIHSKEYYKDLLEMSEKNTAAGLATTPVVRLYIAKHEDDYLAGIITLFTPYEAVYVYGASSNVKRNLMPAYLLQWTAIKDGKAFGSRFYDFYGMPPTDDENHPMHGLYRFKTGFGGQNTHRVGSLDVPTSKLYGMYRFAEKMRSFYFKKVKKFFAGR